MIGWVVVAAVFVLVLFVCLRVLPDMGFDGLSRMILAFCIAALSGVSVVLLAPMSVRGGALKFSTDFHLNFILLPFAALGLSLVGLLMVVLLLRLFAHKTEGAQSKGMPPEPRLKNYWDSLGASPHRLIDGRERDDRTRKDAL